MHRSTEKKAKAFLEVLRNNSGNVKKSCEEFGITRQCYYLWLNDERFARSVREIEDELFDIVEEKLFDLIKKGEYRAIEFYLKTKGKNKGYTTGSDIEVSGGGVTKIIIKPYGGEKKEK